MSRPFKKISAGRSVHNGDILVWINPNTTKRTHIDIRQEEFDATLIACVQQQATLPKRTWYYRVYVFQKERSTKRIRVERVSMKQEDDLLPWCEAFEVWCAYARML